MIANQNRHYAYSFLQVANKLDNLLISKHVSLNSEWSLLTKLNGSVQSCLEPLRPHKLYIKEIFAFVKFVNIVLHSILDENFKLHTMDNSQDLKCSSTTKANNTNKLVPLTKMCAEKTQKVLLNNVDVPRPIKKIKFKQGK
jgi:hypothetical protein